MFPSILTGLVFLLAMGPIGPSGIKGRIPEPRVLSEKLGAGNCLRVSPDGRLLAVAAIDSGVSLWRLPSGDKLHSFAADNSTTVCFSKDGKEIAFGHEVYDERRLRWLGRVTMVDATTGKGIAILDDHLMSISNLDCDPDAQMFCFLSTELFLTELARSEIILWDGKNKSRQLTKKGMYDHLAFLAGKGFFAVDTSDDLYGGAGGLRIPRDCSLSFMESPSGRESVRIRSSAISALALSQDRRLIATVGYKPNTDVRILDVVKFKEIGRLPRENDGHAIIAFGLKGRIIACAETDGVIRFWDVTTRALLGDLRSAKHLSANNPIMSMVFTPDGRLLITATAKGSVHLWDVKDYFEAKLK